LVNNKQRKERDKKRLTRALFLIIRDGQQCCRGRERVFRAKQSRTARRCVTSKSEVYTCKRRRSCLISVFTVASQYSDCKLECYGRWRWTKALQTPVDFPTAERHAPAGAGGRAEAAHGRRPSAKDLSKRTRSVKCTFVREGCAS